jgi:hypothetical protein
LHGGRTIIAYVPFSVSFPTRHTDAFAATGFVHAGAVLALGLV